MGRPKGAGNIVGWQLHDIHRRLAAGDSPGVIAEAHGKPVQTIYDIRWRDKAKLAEILTNWSNEFTDIPRVNKHNRLAELNWLAEEQLNLLLAMKEEAEAATEAMRQHHPDAATVSVPKREWNACVRQLAKLDEQIATEMGQLPHLAGNLLAGVPSVLSRRNLVGLGRAGDVKVFGPEPVPPGPSQAELEREARKAESAARMKSIEDMIEAAKQAARVQAADQILAGRNIVPIEECEDVKPAPEAVEDSTPEPLHEEPLRIRHPSLSRLLTRGPLSTR